MIVWKHTGTAHGRQLRNGVDRPTSTTMCWLFLYLHLELPVLPQSLPFSFLYNYTFPPPPPPHVSPFPLLPRHIFGQTQVYVYRGAIQHHGIVVHVPKTHGTYEAPSDVPSLSSRLVHVVHFDSACDGVETTALETFLNVGALSVSPQDN